MIDPGLRQEAERIHAGVIWLVGLSGLAVTALLVVIAWLLAVPPPAHEHPVAKPSPSASRSSARSTRWSPTRA